MKAESVFAVYFPLSGKMDSPFSDKGYYSAYRLFGAYCAERGVGLRIVRGDSYQGGMSFSGGWRFDKQGSLQEVGPLTANLILNKSGLIQSFDMSARVLNDPYLEGICSDKLSTYRMFASQMPLTIAYVPGHFDAVLERIKTAKIILKPCNGAAGRGIFTFDRDQVVPNELGRHEPYLAQEFIDTSAGIPGIVEGMHDIRIFMFNGVPRLAYTRTPKKGSLLANIALGGTMMPVEIDVLPKAILKATEQIDDVFRHCTPRFYSADFMYEGSTRPYLVELNSRPGFPSLDYADDAFRAVYFERLFEIIQ